MNRTVITPKMIEKAWELFKFESTVERLKILTEFDYSEFNWVQDFLVDYYELNKSDV